MNFEEIYEKWTSITNETERLRKVAKKREREDSKKDLQINQTRRMKCQDQIDLHSLTVEEAVQEVQDFIKSSYYKDLKKIKIIHGKGLHSLDGVSQVKVETINILKKPPYVREIIKPPVQDGGSGASWVILKSRK